MDDRRPKWWTLPLVFGLFPIALLWFAVEQIFHMLCEWIENSIRHH